MGADGYLVLSNRTAGNGRSEELDAALDVLERHGSVDIAEAEDVEDVLDALGTRSLVVAGGDGTLHHLANALSRKGRLGQLPVALLPLGTGNDMARLLGLPLEPADAARCVVRGRPRRLDVLRTDRDEIVVNAAHLGLGAEASARASGLKESLGAAAYPLGAALAAASEPSWTCEVSIDGEILAEGEVALVGIGNGPSIGGGSPLVPSAVPDDGLLDVVVIDARDRGDLARLGLALREGTHVDLEGVSTARGRRVRYEGEPTPVNLDGEVVGERGACTFEVVSGAWSVIAPA